MNGTVHIQDLVRPPAPTVEASNFTRQSSSGPSIGHRSSSRDGRHAFDQMSRSASAGETAVDAAKWFATDGTVPGVETLRGDAKIQLNLDDCGQPSENLAQLIRDCGVSPRKISELVNELPSFTFASQLVDWFFSHINYVRYPIHEAGFRAAFEDMYRKKGGVGPEPHNVRSLPLIFIVLATSVRLAPSEWAGDDSQRKMISLKMYWGCKSRSKPPQPQQRITKIAFSSSPIDLDSNSHPAGKPRAGSDSAASELLSDRVPSDHLLSLETVPCRARYISS